MEGVVCRTGGCCCQYWRALLAMVECVVNTAGGHCCCGLASACMAKQARSSLKIINCFVSWSTVTI